MTITEESRNDLYQGLTEVLGKQRANTLMEHLPPGGWKEVATKQDLRELRSDMRAEFAEFRGEMRTDFEEFRGEVRAEFEEFRGEVRAELAVFRGEVRTDFQEFRGEMCKDFQDFRGEVSAEFAEFRGEMLTELHKLLRVHTLAVVVIVATLMTLFDGALRLLG
ncbi:MAG: hypothetical protein KY443_02345 [Actinobacteria bacterium]|nr:hypothetical protein [Actinomycetota bacterium]